MFLLLSSAISLVGFVSESYLSRRRQTLKRPVTKLPSPLKGLKTDYPTTLAAPLVGLSFRKPDVLTSGGTNTG